MTKIRKDRFGLYVNAGGYRSRPFYGSCFKEGDAVVAHHFGGSTFVGVGLPGKASFRRSRNNRSFEYWCTTGTGATEHATDKNIADSIQWYWEHCRAGAAFFAESHNHTYASSVRRTYREVYRNRDVLDLIEVTAVFGKICL